MTKKKISFADMAKKELKKYKFRLGDDYDKYDPITIKSLNRDMESLAKKQEIVRNKKVSSKTNQNELPEFNYGGELDWLDPNIYQGLGANYNEPSFATNTAFGRSTSPTMFQQYGRSPSVTSAMGGNKSGFGGLSGLQMGGMGANLAAGLGSGITGLIGSSRNKWRGFRLDPREYALQERDPLKLGADSKVSDPEEIKAKKLNAELIDLSGERSGIKSRASTDISRLGNIARTSGNQSSLFNQMMAGTTEVSSQANRNLTESALREQGVNTQAINQMRQLNVRNKLHADTSNVENTMRSDMFNAGNEFQLMLQNRANEMSTERYNQELRLSAHQHNINLEMARRQMRTEALNSIFGSIGGLGGDLMTMGMA